jgi:hypothetical protein
MDHFSVRRRTLAFGALGAVLLLTACEDKRIKELTTGITRDSAVTILAQSIKGGGRDSFPNVYDRSRYLINGQNIEVLYFSKDNEKKHGADTLSYKKYTPIVFLDNKLIAKGWPAWDSISTANKIPLKQHDK